MTRIDWLDELAPSVRPIIEGLWTPAIRHPNLARAMDEVRAGLAGPPTKPFVTVTGPTRSGKTTLLELLEEESDERYGWVREQRAYADPVVRFEVTAPPSGIFSFAGCFVDPLVDALALPAKDRRQPLIHPGPDVRIMRTASRRLSPVEAIDAAIQACDDYHVRVLLCDEAHHFGMVRGPDDYMRNLEALKTFANKAGVRLVLAGTHDLHTVRDMSAQMICRSTDVRLPRYRLDSAEDTKGFRALLAAIDRRTPAGTQPLEPEWAMIHARTLGCVGILIDAVLAAVAQAAVRNDLARLLGYFDRTALNPDQIEGVRVEIEADDGVPVRPAAGKPGAAKKSGSTRPSRAGRADGHQPGNGASVPRARKVRVGRRRPHRDPVHVGGAG